MPRLSVSFLISVMGTLLRAITTFWQVPRPLHFVDRRCSAGQRHSSKTPYSPFRISCENVILRRHPGMAGEPALGTAWIEFGRSKRVGSCIIGPLGIGPSVRVRESLGILFDERDGLQRIRHIYEVGG